VTTKTPTTASVQRTPFSVTTSQTRGAVPSVITARGHYDPATTRGAVCFLVEGPESHRSCWVEDGNGPALRVEPFYLGTPGIYTFELVGERQRARTEVVIY
jgi:hypothetical protein